MKKLDNIKYIHFVGIKGVAMTALAILAKERGMTVTGSDVDEEFPTDITLGRFHIAYQRGFAPNHLPVVLDLVVYTGAHQGIHNLEVQEAKRRGIQVLPHGKALGLFMDGKRGITVVGSHGKTTTSAMIAHILTQLGKDPSFAIGCGEILSLKTSGHWGTGEFFVAEGDEYATDPTSDKTPRFMWQKPETLVITNIDFDHPDVYGNLSEVKQAFIELVNSLPADSLVVINVDNEVSASIIPQLKRRVITYGESTRAKFQFGHVTFGTAQTEFEIVYNGKKLSRYTLKIPGVHNAQNATGAITALVNLGFTVHELVEPLKSFIGTKRRFELIGKKNGKLLYDDYAHHPVEISATLKAARDWFPQARIIAIFQPHTYSRTQVLMEQFAHSFQAADIVVLTNIYSSAREKPIPGVTGKALFEATKRHKRDIYFAPEKQSVLQYLGRFTRPNDLVLTIGAGDIYRWLGEILKTL